MKNILVSTALVLFSLNSFAAITVVTDKATFTAGISDAAMDDFADMACGDVTLSPVPRTAGSFTYQVTSQFDLYNLCMNPGVAVSPNDALSPLNFEGITGDASAIGADFFTTDIGGTIVAGSVTLLVTDSSGAQAQHTVTAPDTFAGFTSDQTIVSISILATQDSPTEGRWATVNGFILGKSH